MYIYYCIWIVLNLKVWSVKGRVWDLLCEHFQSSCVCVMLVCLALLLKKFIIVWTTFIKGHSIFHNFLEGMGDSLYLGCFIWGLQLIQCGFAQEDTELEDSWIVYMPDLPRSQFTKTKNIQFCNLWTLLVSLKSKNRLEIKATGRFVNC